MCSANYVDFVVATFSNEIANISTERIMLDDEFMKQCIEKSADFFELCILPQLLAKWYSREELMPAQTAETSVPTARDGVYIYCYYKRDKEEKWSHNPIHLLLRLKLVKMKFCPRTKLSVKCNQRKQRPFHS